MDWDHFWTAFFAALIAASPALLAAVAAFLQSIKNGQKSESLRQEVNHRLTELIESTRRAAHLEGEASGTQKERDRLRDDSSKKD
jgi:hypothetical protein